MTTINLRVHYPDIYTHDFFIEVSNEIAAALIKARRQEAAFRRRTYRHKAHYSLDRGDGIENASLYMVISPYEEYERKLVNEQLYKAIEHLPAKQRRRIYAHFFHGMSRAAIARSEGVAENAVWESIERGIGRIKKFF